MNFLADRLGKIKPSITLTVNEKARKLEREGRNIVSLAMGEPDFDTPDHIKAAAIKAMDKGEPKYTAVAGTMPLKQAIQAKFKRENGLDYKLSEIIASSGGKQVLFNAFMAVLNPGDEVIIPAPYWVSYPEMVILAEGTPIIVSCGKEQSFKMCPQDLVGAITPKTKMLLLNSPSNPTGMAYSEAELKGLADVLVDHPHVLILTDDIYEHILFEGQPFRTIAQVEPRLKDRTITMNGVSKSYAMTGWRLGYAGGPEAVIAAMANVQSQSTSCPCSITQAAATEALNGDQSYIPHSRAIFKERRDKALEHVNKTRGLSAIPPQGAFYLFINCEQTFGLKTPKGVLIKDDVTFAEELIEEKGVAVVPGSAFGLAGHFRISYALDTDDLMDALDRITSFTAELS